MTHRRPVRPAPSPPLPQDRSWAARMEGLNREPAAAVAMGCAIYASLSMLIGWTVIIIPSGGNIRGNPLYWLMMAPLLLWIWFLQKSSRWAVNSVGVVTPAGALPVVAGRVRDTDLQGRRSAGPGRHTARYPVGHADRPGGDHRPVRGRAGGLLRSSLPGGTRPITYIVPGTLRPGYYPLPPGATLALMKGSLPFSGALINGMFFAIVAMLETIGPYGEVWPVAVVAVLVLGVGTLVFRGGFRLRRRRAGAARDLSRGWRLGMGCAAGAIPALWALPVPISGKLGFSCFMVPLAAAAIWFGTRALKALPEADRGRTGAGSRSRRLTVKQTRPAHVPLSRPKLPPGPTRWQRLDRATSLLRRVAFTAAFTRCCSLQSCRVKIGGRL